jgi:hypothetical protein
MKLVSTATSLGWKRETNGNRFQWGTDRPRRRFVVLHSAWFMAAPFPMLPAAYRLGGEWGYEWQRAPLLVPPHRSGQPQDFPTRFSRPE